jgi:hypothetical protein
MREWHTTGRTARSRSRRHVRGSAACAAALAAALALAGCGISDTGPVAAGPPASGGLTLDGSEALRVYFVTAQGTWPATRPAPPDAGPQHALNVLLDGPNSTERARGLDTALPAGAHEVRAQPSAGTVDLYLPWAPRSDGGPDDARPDIRTGVRPSRVRPLAAGAGPPTRVAARAPVRPARVRGRNADVTHDT